MEYEAACSVPQCYVSGHRSIETVIAARATPARTRRLLTPLFVRGIRRIANQKIVLAAHFFVRGPFTVAVMQ